MYTNTYTKEILGLVDVQGKQLSPFEFSFFKWILKPIENREIYANNGKEYKICVGVHNFLCLDDDISVTLVGKNNGHFLIVSCRHVKDDGSCVTKNLLQKLYRLPGRYIEESLSAFIADSNLYVSVKLLDTDEYLHRSGLDLMKDVIGTDCSSGDQFDTLVQSIYTKDAADRTQQYTRRAETSPENNISRTRIAMTSGGTVVRSSQNPQVQPENDIKKVQIYSQDNVFSTFEIPSGQSAIRNARSQSGNQETSHVIPQAPARSEKRLAIAKDEMKHHHLTDTIIHTPVYTPASSKNTLMNVSYNDQQIQSKIMKVPSKPSKKVAGDLLKLMNKFNDAVVIADEKPKWTNVNNTAAVASSNVSSITKNHPIVYQEDQPLQTQSMEHLALDENIKAPARRASLIKLISADVYPFTSNRKQPTDENYDHDVSYMEDTNPLREHQVLPSVTVDQPEHQEHQSQTFTTFSHPYEELEESEIEQKFKNLTFNTALNRSISNEENDTLRITLDLTDFKPEQLKIFIIDNEIHVNVEITHLNGSNKILKKTYKLPRNADISKSKTLFTHQGNLQIDVPIINVEDMLITNLPNVATEF
ncbi:hypothetical protein GJ496_002815 [Pomphorhynchus laevis]|nr:hypothetical protein GJ496_002815 [Pomphorhynchus laevis]